MDSVNYKNKNMDESTYGHTYNLQSIVFVSKCRFKVFKKPKTKNIIKTAIYQIAAAYKIKIKEFAFGEDFAQYTFGCTSYTDIEELFLVRSISIDAELHSF